MKSGGLTKWFSEKWVDIGAKKKGGEYQDRDWETIRNHTVTFFLHTFLHVAIPT